MWSTKVIRNCFGPTVLYYVDDNEMFIGSGHNMTISFHDNTLNMDRYIHIASIGANNRDIPFAEHRTNGQACLYVTRYLMNNKSPVTVKIEEVKVTREMCLYYPPKPIPIGSNSKPMSSKAVAKCLSEGRSTLWEHLDVNGINKLCVRFTCNRLSIGAYHYCICDFLRLRHVKSIFTFSNTDSGMDILLIFPFAITYQGNIDLIKSLNERYAPLKFRPSGALVQLPYGDGNVRVSSMDNGTVCFEEFDDCPYFSEFLLTHVEGCQYIDVSEKYNKSRELTDDQLKALTKKQNEIITKALNNDRVSIMKFVIKQSERCSSDTYDQLMSQLELLQNTDPKDFTRVLRAFD